MNPALLVIDIQKQFFDLSPEVTQSLQNAIEYVNAAIAIFREKGFPVICVQHINEEDGLVPGAAGFDIPEELNILASDIHIHKHKGSAFVNTNLQQHLEELKVDTLILTGFCAEFCVLSTYRGAKDLDYTAILLRGSLASDDSQHIRFVEEISEIISYGALKKMLE